MTALGNAWQVAGLGQSLAQLAASWTPWGQVHPPWGLANGYPVAPPFCPHCEHCAELAAESQKVFVSAAKAAQRQQVLDRIAKHKIEVLSQMERQ